MKQFYRGALAASLVVMSQLAWADGDQAAKGKELFTSGAKPMACAVCHTLADAGATGTIGPDLDELQPSIDQIKQVMIEGMGAMPSFAQTLSDEDREALAVYVNGVAGK